MILQSLCRIFDLKHWRAWLPSRGNVLFTLIVAASLLSYAQSAGAFPSRATTAASTSVIPYQGRLTNTTGAALTGSYNMTFKLYGVVSGGSVLWSEVWSSGNAVAVSNGLFNVLLGSLTPLPQSVIANNSSLWLGITVGTDSEMSPRIQLGSAPFAMQALSVPTGAITTTMLADGAVTVAKLSSQLALGVTRYAQTAPSWNPIAAGWNDVPGGAITQVFSAGTWKATLTGSLGLSENNGTIYGRFQIRPLVGQAYEAGNITIMRSGWNLLGGASSSEIIALQATIVLTQGQAIIAPQLWSNFNNAILSDAVFIIEK